MLILAISTSSKICSVALLEDKKCIKELNIENQKTHSENLVPLIDELFKTTGKTLSHKKREETIFEINLEAAIESARQLRLRNISGIILIDFINMESKEHTQRLL